MSVKGAHNGNYIEVKLADISVTYQKWGPLGLAWALVAPLEIYVLIDPVICIDNYATLDELCRIWYGTLFYGRETEFPFLCTR